MKDTWMLPMAIFPVRSVLFTTLKKIASYIKKMFWLPSRFQPSYIEEDFNTKYSVFFLRDRRGSVLLALTTWTAYFGWDVFHGVKNSDFAPYFVSIMIMRMLGSICLIITTIAIFSKHAKFESFSTMSLSLCVCFCYSMLLSMIYCSSFPYNYLFYFIGLPLVMVFMFGLLRLRAKAVLFLSAFCVISSSLVLPYTANNADIINNNTVSSYYYLPAISYIISFAIVGFAVAVELERTARLAYFREKNLRHAGQALTDKNDELGRLNLALQKSEWETKSKTEALIKMKDDLRLHAEQRSLEKSKFLADAAHDLRQPMQALSNILEAANFSIDKGDTRKVKELLLMAVDASRITRSSFNAVLDISRLESGFVEAIYRSFDLDELIGIIVGPQLALASEMGVNVRIRRSKHKVVVRSDPHLLDRVISNILSNSIKYSDPNKKEKRAVLIGIVKLNNKVRVDLVDNGIGIERDKWSSVFEPFVQLHNPERDRDKGVGLGLSIVNAIIRILSEHRIEMTSKENRGTRFSLEIPISEEIGECISLNSDIKASNESDLAGIYIVYIEDDYIVRRSTIEMFDAHGILYEVYSSFEDAEEGLKSLDRLPDLLLMDYRLPNGYTAKDIITLSSIILGEEIPSIILTGEVIPFEISDLLGTVKIFQKPVSPELLLSQISVTCS